MRLFRLATSRHSRLFRTAGVYSGILVYWYLAAYVLMVDWRRLNTNKPDTSFYRFAQIHTYHPAGGFSTVETHSCWANRVFWPIDRLVRLWIDRIDENPRVRELLEVVDAQPEGKEMESCNDGLPSGSVVEHHFPGAS